MEERGGFQGFGLISDLNTYVLEVNLSTVTGEQGGVLNLHMHEYAQLWLF